MFRFPDDTALPGPNYSIGSGSGRYYSEVVFFTVDDESLTPGYMGGVLKNNVNSWGDLPTPVPEPLGLVMLLTGVPFAGFFAFRRRR